VHHPDPRAFDLDHAPFRKQLLQLRLVHVPEDRLDGRDRFELSKHRGADEVAAVHDQVGALQLTQAGLGKAARPARQVRVGDDGDAGQADRKRPSR
jgi:hypothetical protein